MRTTKKNLRRKSAQGINAAPPRDYRLQSTKRVFVDWRKQSAPLMRVEGIPVVRFTEFQ